MWIRNWIVIIVKMNGSLRNLRCRGMLLRRGSRKR